MKAAIPVEGTGVLDAPVAQHFGRATSFVLAELGSGEASEMPNRGQHFGGTRRPTDAILEAGADAVLCAGLGRRAIAMFRGAGVDVYVGASGCARDVLEAYMAGRLRKADEADGCPGREGA